MWAVRGKRQVANGAVGLARLSIIPDAAVHHAIEIGIFVDAVNKAEVRIIGADGCQALLELRNSGSRLGRPPIRSAFVQCSDVHLDVHPVAMTAENAPHRFKGRRFARYEVEMIDPRIDGYLIGALDLGCAGIMDARRSQTDHANLVAAVWQGAIFHGFLHHRTYNPMHDGTRRALVPVAVPAPASGRACRSVCRRSPTSSPAAAPAAPAPASAPAASTWLNAALSRHAITQLPDRRST